MANFARQQSFAAYKLPVLHKFGVMRDAKDGGLASKCKCGTWAFGETSGPLGRAEAAHLAEQEAIRVADILKNAGAR
jgi:hypothetical protein